MVLELNLNIKPFRRDIRNINNMEDSNKSDYSFWNFGTGHMLVATLIISIIITIQGATLIYFLKIENKSLNDKANFYKSSLDKSLDNEKELIKLIPFVKY